MTEKSQFHRDELAQYAGYDDYESMEYNAKFWGEDPEDHFYMCLYIRLEEMRQERENFINKTK